MDGMLKVKKIKPYLQRLTGHDSGCLNKSHDIFAIPKTAKTNSHESATETSSIKFAEDDRKERTFTKILVHFLPVDKQKIIIDWFL